MAALTQVYFCCSQCVSPGWGCGVLRHQGACVMRASKENMVLHCYSAGINQSLLSACRGAVTAEITCFHKALSALRRESLALNPLHCLVYSFFNYRQSQVSTVTDTVSLCKSMRQHYKGRRVFPESLCCSEPWVSAVLMELTRAKLLSPWGSHHPPSLSHRGIFWSGSSSNQPWKLCLVWE